MTVSTGRVLVTGATRGIGRATVEALLDAGGRVAAVGRDEDALGELKARGAIALCADLTVPAERDNVVARALEALGGLDGVVCAAGVVRYRAVSEVTDEDLRAQVELNVLSTFRIAQDGAAALRAQGGGAMVLVGSTLAERAAPLTSVYAATKAAVHALSRSMALELAPHGVRVNAVAPGVIDTDMVRVPRMAEGEPAPPDAERQARVDAELQHLRRLHPLGRLGRADEVAAMIVHLLDATFVTGAVWTVDGGLSLG